MSITAKIELYFTLVKRKQSEKAKKELFDDWFQVADFLKENTHEDNSHVIVHGWEYVR